MKAWNALKFARITSRLAVLLLPFALFGIIYWLLGFYPNYLVRPIDTEGVYHLELQWFGVWDEGIRVIPSAYFMQHHWVLADLLAGVFYLCWVPVPILFGIYLYFQGKEEWCVRFSWAFLIVNLIGFTIYYVFPASPPWYILEHGFVPMPGMHGNAAGLLRFDALIGVPFFQNFYAHNCNVFAAIPSLHAAYVLIAVIYAVKSKCSHWLISFLLFICVGIWCTAVYTAHHYVIDVLLGIATTIVGVNVWEWMIRIRTLTYKNT